MAGAFGTADAYRAKAHTVSADRAAAVRAAHRSLDARVAIANRRLARVRVPHLFHPSDQPGAAAAIRSAPVRVHVAFTPAEVTAAPTAIVVDVLRATSTIAQALAAGYSQVVCCEGVDEARALATTYPGSLLAGERKCVRIEGFDFGNSPSEFVEPRAERVILTTTNGTRALVAAATRCERVFAGSLVNLAAVVGAARQRGGDIVVMCAGVLNEFAMDDAYVAGRIVELLGADTTDAAEAALRLCASFADARAGLSASQSARNLTTAGLDEDIDWCARESVLDVVPVVGAVDGLAVTMSAAST